jgi:hypothetical protein
LLFAINPVDAILLIGVNNIRPIDDRVITVLSLLVQLSPGFPAILLILLGFMINRGVFPGFTAGFRILLVLAECHGNAANYNQAKYQ